MDWADKKYAPIYGLEYEDWQGQRTKRGADPDDRNHYYNSKAGRLANAELAKEATDGGSVRG